MIANLRTCRCETFIRENIDRMTLKQSGIATVMLNVVLNVCSLQIFTGKKAHLAIEARQTLKIGQSQQGLRLWEYDMVAPVPAALLRRKPDAAPAFLLHAVGPVCKPLAPEFLMLIAFQFQGHV